MIAKSSEARHLRNLLKNVSRSFYLTLAVLPSSIKEQIGLAYLLARASDTIADTPLMEISRKLDGLHRFQQSIQEACGGGKAALPDLGELAEAQEITTGEGTAAERMLLKEAGLLLDALRGFSGDDRRRIRKLLDTIIHGQETDLLRFPAQPDSLAAFDTDEELDAYTYDVAGCVGEFWTEMCRAHVFPKARLDDARLLNSGVLFGKGLQLVNILRDIPRDLRRGRCYIPANRLAERGLIPRDLVDERAIDRFRPLYDMYLEKALDYLAAGWDYTTSLPYRCPRIRLACAWPVLIGAKTLCKLQTANILDEGQRVKVSRSEIRRLMLQSMLRYPFRAAWNLLFRKN
jgi:farnesyl-diphosphate farnesyltransferase